MHDDDGELGKLGAAVSARVPPPCTPAARCPGEEIHAEDDEGTVRRRIGLSKSLPAAARAFGAMEGELPYAGAEYVREVILTC